MAIYKDPPTLAPQFGSIFAIPLEHRLKMPLQVAEQWLSMIAHQVWVTKHNLSILLSQHKPMQSHIRTMRREARAQAKERQQPNIPRKAHSRAVQAAVKAMRDKLNAKKGAKKRRTSTARRSTLATGLGTPRPPFCPSPRHHPP